MLFVSLLNISRRIATGIAVATGEQDDREPKAETESETLHCSLTILHYRYALNRLSAGRFVGSGLAAYGTIALAWPSANVIGALLE
jgi:hypothetical protein